MRYLLVSLLVGCLSGLNAQTDSTSYKYDLSIDLGIGRNSGSGHIALHRDWRFGKADRIFVGAGIRTSMFTGRNVYFTSAPPDLAASSQLQDSILAPTPFIYDLNVMIQFGVNFTSKLKVGFNIDLAGVSFGPHGRPTFISDGVEEEIQVMPTPLNLLLVGANDRGSLVSQLFFRYRFTERLSAQASLVTMVNELTTNTESQIDPVENRRFRSLQNQLSAGVSFRL